MTIVAPKVCPDCGVGKVVSVGGPGRTRRRRGGGQMPIPDDVLIPTCQRCGVEWMDEETAIALSALDGLV